MSSDVTTDRHRDDGKIWACCMNCSWVGRRLAATRKPCPRCRGRHVRRGIFDYPFGNKREKRWTHAELIGGATREELIAADEWET